MILDKYLSFDTKVYIALVFSGLWIYFRTEQCYEMIPRHKIFTVIFVMIWTYLNYYESRKIYIENSKESVNIHS